MRSRRVICLILRFYARNRSGGGDELLRLLIMRRNRARDVLDSNLCRF